MLRLQNMSPPLMDPWSNSATSTYMTRLVTVEQGCDTCGARHQADGTSSTPMVIVSN